MLIYIVPIGVVLFVAYRKWRYPIQLRFQLLHHGAMLAYWISGMLRDHSYWAAKKPWRSLLGTDGRRTFEGLRSVLNPSIPAGDWDGVSSVDIDIPGLTDQHPRVPCRIYRPSLLPQSTSLPTCVWLHGGGWTVSHVNDPAYDLICRKLCLGGPWLVVAPEYRLAPENPFPAGLCDAYACAAWAAKGTDPALESSDRAGLILAGDSAGGNLAAVISLLSLNEQDPLEQPCKLPVRHQLLVYPGLNPAVDSTLSRVNPENQWFIPQSIMSLFETVSGNYLHRAHDWRVSPLVAPNLSGVAAATVVLAEFDPLLDEGRQYAQKMRDAGVNVAVQFHSGVPHGFFCPDLPLPLYSACATRAVDQALAAVQSALAM